MKVRKSYFFGILIIPSFHLFPVPTHQFENLEWCEYGNLQETNGKQVNISGFYLTQGSCVEGYKNVPPAGDWFSTTRRGFPKLPINFDDGLASMQACESTFKYLHCPKETWVKKVDILLGIQLWVEIYI